MTKIFRSFLIFFLFLKLQVTVVIVMATVNSAHCSNVMMIICDKNTWKQETREKKIKINSVVNRKYSIFNMFTESNYFVNFCLNMPPPSSTVSIFCECAEHKNSEFYSFYINGQWWWVSKWNIMHSTLLLSEHFCPPPFHLLV